MIKPLILTIFCILLNSAICRADEIDDLIPAIIQIESGGNPRAVSPKGAIGILQITPIVLEEYNQVEKRIIKGPLFDPQVNIEYGQWYLRRLKDHYLKDKYTIERMLAAYNGGITRLRDVNYDVSKMSSETKNYVKKVMQIYLSVQEHAKQYQSKSKDGVMEKVEPGYGR